MKRQPTTQQITWFLDLYRNKQLDLEPPYQRKSVWSSKDKKFFLDTIFRNYPAPPVFIHRSVNDQGYTKYHVVDGKQRLETILSFYENKISMASDFGDVNLDGKKFKNISGEYKRVFWDYTLVVDFIDSIDGNNIEEVFDRVNRNARNLLPQELRHAKYNGWFISLCEEEADSDFWWDFKISTKGRDRRMKNVQFISEALMIVLENKIVGFDQARIDSVYADYDDIEEMVEQGVFNLEDFVAGLKFVKEFIVEMEKENGCISQFAAGSNNNFYTLWALIYLKKPINSSELAQKYTEFMNQVGAVKEKQEKGEVIGESILQYFNNSTGAVTDFAQRNERLNALTSIL